MSPQTAHSDVMGESRGRTTKTRTRFPALSAQLPPTQGHDRDMGTPQNTAAIYLRKSSLDDRSGDNRSISDQRHDLERLGGFEVQQVGIGSGSSI